MNDDSECLVEWAEQQVGGDLARKVRRFDEITGPERHLFIVVHDSGMPMSHYHPLTFGETVPRRAPELPMGLTGLWLLPYWSGTVLWWHRDSGWVRSAYSDDSAS